MLGGERDEDANGAGIPLWMLLGAALAVLLVVRLYPIGSVFRGGDVVLISNDPWVFRYLVDQALTEGAISRANPTVNWRAEPLLIWTLAFVATLLGGVERTGLVLAVYPVITALISGILVFVLARLLTDDVRIGLAAVVILAVTPLHVSRTALGFSDHHAFDYLWLLLTATALTWLVVRTDAETRHRWAMGGVLGVAVAGQTLAWRVSPLMLVPTAGAVGAASIIVVRREDPVKTLAPVVAGFGLAAVLVQLIHQTLAWQNTVVAGTPVLLFVGGVAVLGLLAVVTRRDRSWPALLGAELAAVGLVVVLVWLLAPGFVEQILGRAGAFSEYIQTRQESGIGETAPILSAFGPIAGPIILLGFAPFLGLPAVAWGLVRGWRQREAAWFILAVYVAWFLALAFIQRRWAVQLGLFLSVFAGIGFVGLAYRLALLLPPIPLRDDSPPDQTTLDPPDRTRVALLGSMGAIGVGSGAMFSKFILDQLSYDDAAYGAATWMRAYAEERGWTYPQNYILAEWGRVRMYNYLVNGQSRSYWYARNNYEDFIFSGGAEGWYEEFEGRVGFIVTRPLESSSFTLHARLHDHYGSASATGEGVGHYRAVWEHPDGSEKVFTVVPGATVTGEAAPDTSLTVSTSVTLAGTENTIEYRRQVETDAEGAFSVVLAHPGEYTVGDVAETLTVDEAAIQEGSELSITIPETA